MRIQEVSQIYEVTPDTLRYYEKIGLLDKVQKDKSGKRDYQETDLKRLEFIKCMRSAGLSIQVLKQYIDLLSLGETSLQQRKELLIHEREELIKKQERIQLSLDKLNHKIENYEKLLICGRNDNI